ncbi:hypothetical protein Syun_022533 [Stephania yunnanensis]|uniref:Uncharacterized protein n=1 Tax=Stephania yunnanensis TaxID=152371 RepID=A0AAP0F9T9_9MAGN
MLPPLLAGAPLLLPRQATSLSLSLPSFLSSIRFLSKSFFFFLFDVTTLKSLQPQYAAISVHVDTRLEERIPVRVSAHRILA